MCHEGFFPAVLKMMTSNIQRIWDPDRVVVILDHYIPAPSESMAGVHAQIRQMIGQYGVTHYYGEREGICHQVMIEKGQVRPGDLIVGSDSHTCTYGALGAAASGIGISEMSYVLATGELWFQVPKSIRICLDGRLAPAVGSTGGHQGCECVFGRSLGRRVRAVSVAGIHRGRGGGFVRGVADCFEQHVGGVRGQVRNFSSG